MKYKTFTIKKTDDPKYPYDLFLADYQLGSFTDFESVKHEIDSFEIVEALDKMKTVVEGIYEDE